MATHPHLLRRAGLLTLLLATLGTPAWAEAGPHQRPAVQGARISVPYTREGTGADAGTDDGGIPGIVPIGCGLLLTGIAVYKHRGLPRSND